MDSLCHPWFTTTNLSYRFPIFETSATALCGTTGTFFGFAQSSRPLSSVSTCLQQTCYSLTYAQNFNTSSWGHGQVKHFLPSFAMAKSSEVINETCILLRNLGNRNRVHHDMSSNLAAQDSVHWCRRWVKSTRFRRRFRRFRRRSGRLWCRARSGSTGFRRRLRFQESLVQSRIKFNGFRRRFRWRSGRLWCRSPEKVLEKVPGSLGAKPSQVQRVPEKLAEAKPGQVHLTHGNLAEVFPALGFPARFRKICKNKKLRLLGIPAKLIFLKALNFWNLFHSRIEFWDQSVSLQVP